MNHVIQYDSVLFDTENKTMEILDGTKGIYPYTEIVECKRVNELAKYKGKEEPFTHIYYGGRVQGRCFGEKGFYVGLKITLKDGSFLAIYISKKKYMQEMIFRKEIIKKRSRLKI